MDIQSLFVNHINKKLRNLPFIDGYIISIADNVLIIKDPNKSSIGVSNKRRHFAKSLVHVMIIDNEITVSKSGEHSEFNIDDPLSPDKVISKIEEFLK